MTYNPALVPPPSPQSVFNFYDDLLQNATPSGYLVSVVLTGALLWNPAADPGHPGILRLTTGTNVGGAIGADIGSITALVPSGGPMMFESTVRVPTLSDGTNTFRVQIGFNDGAQVAPVNKGFYFSYTHSEAGGQWRGAVNDAGSPSFANTGITVVAGTWYRLGITVDAPGTGLSFYINGNLVATAVANPANAGSYGAGIVKSAGASARTLDLDYFTVAQTFTP